MGVYVQAHYIAVPWKCSCFEFALVELVAPLCLQWPMPQLLPVSWASKTGQCSVYLSLMSMAKRDKYFSLLHLS